VKKFLLIMYALWAAPLAKKYPRLEPILSWPLPKK
jgi:hypothetical protein